MKRMCLLAVAVMMLLAYTCYAAESENSHCHHQWRRYDKSTYRVFVEEQDADDDVHRFGYYGTGSCSECGEENNKIILSYTAQRHAFDVISCVSLEDDALEILYRCRICGYERRENSTLQIICDGSADTCLLGGVCPDNIVGYMNDRGTILQSQMPDGLVNYDSGEREWLIAIIYDPAAHTFQFASRDYCPICGRPRVHSFEFPALDFNENWNGFPIMTKEYFLTIDMPSKLPYQLIDRLRMENGSV